MVASYVFGDFKTTTLNATVSTVPSAGTSEAWTVVSTAALPGAATGTSQFTAQISSPAGEVSPEVVLVTNTNDATHFQVQRGYGGTIKTHASGDVLTLVIDSAWLNLMESLRISGGGGGTPTSPVGVSPFPLVTINVGDTWQTVVNANPTAKTFVVKAGLHQNQFVTLNSGTNDNVYFLGEPGAIADGGMIKRTVSDATTHGNNSLTSASNAFLASDFSGTTPTIVWGGPGWNANAGAQISAFVNTGSVTMDDSTSASQSYVATLVKPPNANCTFFMAGTAKNVTIRGIEIRNYAIIRNRSAIFPQNGDNPSAYTDRGRNWTVENCSIHDNSNCAVRVCHGAILRKNWIYNNGDQGVGGGGIGFLIEWNEVYNNNAYNNNPGFDAAGMKFAVAYNCKILNNEVHDNNSGVGIWFDVECADTWIEGNRVYGNQAGIAVETCYRAKVFTNSCWDNGPTPAVFSPYGGGGNIIIAASVDVEVAYNKVGEYGTGAFNGITVLFQNRHKVGPTVTRTITDGVFNGTPTFTSATAKFDTGDLGAFVSGSGITGTVYITGVTSATTVSLSASPATASGQTVNIARFTSNYESPAPTVVGQPNYIQPIYNVSVHHNNIRMIGNAYAAGMASDVANATSMFTSDVITFYANSYEIDPSQSGFAWNATNGNFAFWQAAGQDTTATHTTPNPNQGSYTLPGTTTQLVSAANKA